MPNVFSAPILAVFLVFSLSQSESNIQERADTTDVTCEQALELMQKYEGDTSFVILDFRPKKMYDEAHLENAFYYDIYADGVDAWLETMNRDKIYLIYCNVGKRTRIALDKMRKMGFQNVYHMYEGLVVWKKKGYETCSNVSRPSCGEVAP